MPKDAPGQRRAAEGGIAMNEIAKRFFISSIVYGLLGMLLGLSMAISSDHGQMPTHAHIMVIGWVSFSLFGFYYLQFGKAMRRTLSLVHFWMAQASMASLAIGLWLHYSGRPQFEPVAAVSAIAYALSFLVFAVAVIPVLRAQMK